MEDNPNFPLNPNDIDSAPKIGEPTKRESIASMMFDYMEIIVFSICAVLIVFNLFGRLCRVTGGSMRETLQDGEMLVTTSIGGIDRGDIVVFHQTTNGADGRFNEPLVKRVIAVGGDTVRIDYRSGVVSINGKALAEPYVTLINPNDVYANFPTYGYDPSTGVFEADVPKGFYFVMGDNRNHSADSRDSEVGLVDGRRMLGRVILRITPFTVFN